MADTLPAEALRGPERAALPATPEERLAHAVVMRSLLDLAGGAALARADAVRWTLAMSGPECADRHRWARAAGWPERRVRAAALLLLSDERARQVVTSYRLNASAADSRAHCADDERD